ncbi:MAG: hypothetical protein ACFFDH_03085 [Promethearchaeota archaeon]
MSEKCTDWLVKLKKKYYEEIKNLKKEELQYLVQNYRFEDSTLIFVITIKLQQHNLTMLIINHNSIHEESCKFLGTFSFQNNLIEESVKKIELKIDENRELNQIKNKILEKISQHAKKKTNPQGKGKYRGGGTIGRDKWYYFLFEGKLEDISIDDFFSDPIKEAKKMAQMKKKFDDDTMNRKISLQNIDLLSISNYNVENFIKEVKKDLEKIKNNMTLELIKTFEDNTIVIENHALEKYGFSPEDSSGCKLFEEIIPIENLTIQADLDSRRFTIYIRGLYGYLIEEILPKYISRANEIEEYLILKLNEFITSYKTKTFPYEIILPLTGIVADLKISKGKYKFQISENAGTLLFNDAIIITQNNDFSINRSVLYNINDIETGIRRAISIYGKGSLNFKIIEQNSFLFQFDKSEPESINANKVWIEIRNIFSSFILSNFRIGYSKQFYKFPWWIPKRRYLYDFPTPDWLRNITYFNPSEYMSIDRLKLFQIKDLIPESYRNITFAHPIDKGDEIGFKQGNTKNGKGFFKVDRGRSHEMGFQEIQLKIPSNNFQILKNSFNNYSNKSNPINFYSNQFIFKQLINLRLREKIEDAILDSCLILESLLISGKGEFSYQFRLHASLLLSNNFIELISNINFFNDLYNLRSNIVHGSEGWFEVYKKFLKNNVKWTISYDNDYDQIESSKNDVLNLIFEKIIRIIIRINKIGLPIEDIRQPYNLIANMSFNPLSNKMQGFIVEKLKSTLDYKQKSEGKLLKKLKRIERRLTSIVKSEAVQIPEWYKNLKIAIKALDEGDFENFQKILCSLTLIELKKLSKNDKVLNSIYNNLKQIQERECSEKNQI